MPQNYGGVSLTPLAMVLPPCWWRKGHGFGAIIAHAGHKDPDKLNGRDSFKSGPYQPVGAGVPQIISPGGDRRRNQAGGSATY